MAPKAAFPEFSLPYWVERWMREGVSLRPVKSNLKLKVQGNQTDLIA